MQLEFNLNLFVIFSLISFIVSFLIVKNSNFFFSGSLLDKDFTKPQSFHSKPTARIGGLIILSLFFLFIFFYFSVLNIFLKDYFTIILLLFFLGFLDDLKIKINPNNRLFLMLITLIFCINIFSIQINKSGLDFLNQWLENNMFQTCFVLLCFLFVINGSNLIDGFNGLLAIHFLLITFILLVINFINQNENMTIILISQMIIVFIFLIFNFPNAKIFLGDSGSYLLGSLIVLNVIKTHQLNFEISPFFYASILFYLFYEVFFSFTRKAIKKKSPLYPDKKHLHMLVYKFLLNSTRFKNPNYTTSFLINIVYLVLIIPTIYFQQDGIIIRYWFFSQLLLYTLIYYFLSNSKIK